MFQGQTYFKQEKEKYSYIPFDASLLSLVYVGELSEGMGSWQWRECLQEEIQDVETCWYTEGLIWMAARCPGEHLYVQTSHWDSSSLW